MDGFYCPSHDGHDLRIWLSEHANVKKLKIQMMKYASVPRVINEHRQNISRYFPSDLGNDSAVLQSTLKAVHSFKLTTLWKRQCCLVYLKIKWNYTVPFKFSQPTALHKEPHPPLHTQTFEYYTFSPSFRQRGWGSGMLPVSWKANSLLYLLSYRSLRQEHKDA